MEFVLGATAACGACIVSNPMDVLKTRMQLQGELKARGQYAVIYDNIFHAAVAVAKSDGLKGLQKGLAPALGYQIVMNGTRFGLYQKVADSGILTRDDGSVSSIGVVVAGAGVGMVGGFIGSPLYLVKTQLQSQANEAIAVGFQHKHQGTISALWIIAKSEGIRGLWRGATTSIPRVGVGSASQMFAYAKSKDWLEQYGICSRDSWQSTFVGAMTSGVVIMACMSPFDVISTRLYNQGVDSKGRGLMYSGIMDCVVKILHTEGLWGFYKGWSAIYFRIGPHSFINLILWDAFKVYYENFKKSKGI